MKNSRRVYNGRKPKKKKTSTFSSPQHGTERKSSKVKKSPSRSVLSSTTKRKIGRRVAPTINNCTKKKTSLKKRIPRKPVFRSIFSRIPNEVQFDIIKFMEWGSVLSFRLVSRRFGGLYLQKQVRSYLLKNYPAKARVHEYYKKGGRSKRRRNEIRNKFKLIITRKVNEMGWINPNFESIVFNRRYTAGNWIDELPQTVQERVKKLRYFIDQEKKELFFVFESIVFKPTNLRKDYNLRQDIEPNHFCEDVSCGRVCGIVKLNDRNMFKYVEPSEISSFWARLDRKAVQALKGNIIKIGFVLKTGNRLVEAGPRKRMDHYSCVVHFNFRKFTLRIVSEGEIMIKGIDGSYLQ